MINGLPEDTEVVFVTQTDEELEFIDYDNDGEVIKFFVSENN